MAEIPLVLMLAGLAAYTILGGADFGAGLWALTARGEGASAVRAHTHNAMGPVWEANHVWLIFVLAVCWTAYPEAFASIMSTLTIPVFCAAVGIILRGTTYALQSGNPSPHHEAALTVIFGLSSLLTPFALGAAVGGIASGRVPVGNAAGAAIDSWVNPTSLLIGALAVATAAYMAAIYLAGDAAREGKEDLADAFRTRALCSAVVAGGLALAGPFVLRSDARELYDGLTSGGGLAALSVSALAGLLTVALVARSRFEPARVSAAVAVAAIIAGWGLAQEPELLPGLTIEEAAANDATLEATLVGIGLGALILAPSLALLFRMVLTGRFDPGRAREQVATEASERPPPGGSPLPAAAVLATGAGVTLVFEGWPLAVGLVLMLGGGAALFAALAAAPEGP